MENLTLHTPKGIIKINPETATDQEIAALGVTRARLLEAAQANRNILYELDTLKARVDGMAATVEAYQSLP